MGDVEDAVVVSGRWEQHVVPKDGKMPPCLSAHPAHGTSQELDDEYLVVWDGFDSVPWRYFGPVELRTFLLERIPEGFSFPLNPKWLLCDEGWWEVYAALQASDAAAQALEAWFPGGLRDEMAAIRAAYPVGFQPTGSREGAEEEMDQDKAEWELGRFMALQRAKAKLKAVHRLRKLGMMNSKVREQVALEEAAEAAEAEAPAAEAAAEEAA